MSDSARYAVFTCILFAASVAAGVALTIGDPSVGTQLLDLFREAIPGEVIGTPVRSLQPRSFSTTCRRAWSCSSAGRRLGS